MKQAPVVDEDDGHVLGDLLQPGLRLARSDSPMWAPISVVITIAALVIEKSSPSSACCVASPMISNSRRRSTMSGGSLRAPQRQGART